MKKTVKILALVSMISFVFLSVSALAQEKEWQKAQQLGKGCTMCAPYEAKAWDTFEASWLIGYQVFSPGGMPLGQISNLVLDQENGRVAMVILSDVPGLGHKFVAVPYSSLIRTGENMFELSFGDRELGVVDRYNDRYVYEMTRAPGSSDLYGIPPEMNSAWVAEIYRYYGQTPYWTEKGEHPFKAMELYKSGQLVGMEVRSPKGEAEAKVVDLVIDSADGHIAFLVLSNVPGRGDALVAVPFAALSRSGKNVFVLNITGKKLTSAPSFNENKDLTNLAFAENIYRYFGQQPYWTEEGTR